MRGRACPGEGGGRGRKPHRSGTRPSSLRNSICVSRGGIASAMPGRDEARPGLTGATSAGKGREDR